MDWNLNSDSWDLSEFKQETIPKLESFDSRSASFAADHDNGGGFSIDLKLGRVSHSTDEVINQWKQQPSEAVVSKIVSSPSVSVAKRARAGSNGVQVAYCLVDGCNVDLSNSRDYHKRHKVCEVHSKSPKVTIGGQIQRFCQQCSRFHSLEEFDEGKRSCRKRLDGHNRRRRKPQPDPLSRPANFMPGFRGTRLLPFSSSHVYPSTTVVSPPWSGGVVNAEANAANPFSLQQQINMNRKPSLFFGSSLSSSYRGGKQFPFLHAEDHQTGSPPIPEASVCQPLLNSIALSESSGGGSYSMFCDKLTTATTTQVRDSGCAHSFLSSPRTQTSGNHLHQPNSIPFIQHVDPMDSLLVSNGRDAHSPWSSVNKSPQTLPFNWE